jgi:hypothetical protein
MALTALGAAALTGGIGLIGSLWGGGRAANERKRMEGYLSQQSADNQAWYNANARRDYTQRADAQNLMRQLREQLGKQNAAQANMSIVTGATPEQQAVQKELSNKVISDTYSNLGAQGQMYKDRITDRYLAMKNNISNQRMGMMEGAAQGYENIMNSGVNMMGSVGSGLMNNLIPKE